MDARLDPACEAAVALVRQHEDQDALLVGGSGGQLTAIVKTTQAKQITDHLVRCARCRHYDPRCEECGFDVRRERHGWRCARSPTRFADLFPWNWRAKKAQLSNVPWKHVNAPRAIPGPGPRPGPGPDQAPAPGATRVEVSRPLRVESGPKPRAKPAHARPDSLAVAYASLGVPMDADVDAVRAAYRARAQQYHPDKVAHMAPEFRDVAERKMVEINNAYERIKRSWA